MNTLQKTFAFLLIFLPLFIASPITALPMNCSGTKFPQKIRPARPPRILWHRRHTYKPHIGTRRLLPEQFTTSIIIPCYYKHAHLLYPLLNYYTQQTVLPDEVVISLSEYKQVPDTLLEELAHASWPFPVTLILVAEKQYAGDNRNTACDHARSDVFICQDADDIPHPQRIEIIRHFFHHYPVEHLFHEWIDIPYKGSFTFPRYTDLEQISFAYHRPFQDLWQHGQFTNGNIAITRTVFNTVRWSSAARGQDSTFNKAVYEQFTHGIAIQAKLLGYRQFLSSTKISSAEPERIIMHDTDTIPLQWRYNTTVIHFVPHDPVEQQSERLK